MPYNSFLALIEITAEHNGSSYLAFESHEVTKLLQGAFSGSDESPNNKEKLKLLKKDLRLMPVVIEGDRALAVFSTS